MPPPRILAANDTIPSPPSPSRMSVDDISDLDRDMALKRGREESMDDYDADEPMDEDTPPEPKRPRLISAESYQKALAAVRRLVASYRVKQQTAGHQVEVPSPPSNHHQVPEGTEPYEPGGVRYRPQMDDQQPRGQRNFNNNQRRAKQPPAPRRPQQPAPAASRDPRLQHSRVHRQEVTAPPQSTRPIPALRPPPGQQLVLPPNPPHYYRARYKAAAEATGSGHRQAQPPPRPPRLPNYRHNNNNNNPRHNYGSYQQQQQQRRQYSNGGRSFRGGRQF